MPQTLLSIFALALASLFAFNAQQRGASTTRNLLQSEVEVIMTGVAESTFDQLADVPFDANGAATQAAALSAPASFGNRTWATAVDLDDYHNATTTVSRPVGGAAVDIRVTARVEYVVKLGTAYVATPTTRQLFKRVTLDLTGPLGATATLERLYALDGL